MRDAAPDDDDAMATMRPLQRFNRSDTSYAEDPRVDT
jgi:hypothetical protein